MNKRWKSRMILCLAAVVLLLCSACAGTTPDAQPDTQPPAQSSEPTQSPASEPAPDTQSQAPADTEPAPEPSAEAPTETGTNTLVVYFSATGTTRAVAETIAAITYADLYEIRPAEPYTDADLNWHDNTSRSTIEQNDAAARPAIDGEPVSPEGYATVYVGYPIWWGEEPRIMDTFVESCDFGEATVIPFCTSSSSGIGRSGQNLAEHAGSGVWQDGKRFGAGVSEDELRAWIDGLR